MDSATRASCQWGKLRFKSVYAAGAWKFPGIGGTGTTESGSHEGHGGTESGKTGCNLQLVASLYKKPFRA